MVPKRSPWVHTASAQPATSRLISSGRASVVSRCRAGGQVATEQQVADDAADQVEPVAGGGEALGERAARSASTGAKRSGTTASRRYRPVGDRSTAIGVSDRPPLVAHRTASTTADPGRRWSPPRAGTSTSASARQRRRRSSRPGPRGRSRLRGTRRAGRRAPADQPAPVRSAKSPAVSPRPVMRIAAVGVEAGRHQQPRRRERLRPPARRPRRWPGGTRRRSRPRATAS